MDGAAVMGDLRVEVVWLGVFLEIGVGLWNMAAFMGCDAPTPKKRKALIHGSNLGAFAHRASSLSRTLPKYSMRSKYAVDTVEMCSISSLEEDRWFGASLARTLDLREDFVSIFFFSSQHTDSDDTCRSVEDMVRSLVSQLCQ